MDLLAVIPNMRISNESLGANTMGLSDYLKCPGLERTLDVVPIEVECLRCGKEIEIWSDEAKGNCMNCGRTIRNPNPTGTCSAEKTVEGHLDYDTKLDELIELTINLGSSAAIAVPSQEILIENHLAGLCLETRCPNYGLSPTCPPNVEGPVWLKGYLRAISHAVFLKIEVSHDILYSDRRREVGKLLHFIVIQVEEAAHKMGFAKSRAFAGGSCKSLFCFDQVSCQVLHGNGDCRNPDCVRPSVSGYGININHLLKFSGWLSQNKGPGDSSETGARYGLVVIG